MSLSILPNQALGAQTTPLNGCGGHYLLPCQRGDKYSLQGFSTLVDSSDRGNGQYFDTRWTLGFGWSAVSSSVLHYDAMQGDITTARSQTIGMQTGRLYTYRIAITVNDPGTTTTGEGVEIKINGSFIKLPNAAIGSGQNTSFIVYGYFIPTSIVTDYIEITFNNATINFHVSQLYFIEYSYPMLAAYDSGGNFLQTVDPDLGTKFFTGTAPAPPAALGPVRFEIKFALDQLPDGCLFLKLKEGTGNLLNGNFIGGFAWTRGTGWEISDGRLIHTGNLALAASTRLELLRDTDYTLTFDLYECIGMSVRLTFADSSTLTRSFSGSGRQTWIFFKSGIGTNHYALLEFIPNLLSGSNNFSISTISLQTADEYFISEGILLKASHPFTLLFSATNNDGAFGFDYSKGLVHTIRLNAKHDVTSYPEEAETYIYSDNSETLLFGRTQKEHTVFITDAPVYVHDCLRHLRLHDTFTINGDPYVRQGAYELNRRKTSALKQATFTVVEKESVGSNYRIS